MVDADGSGLHRITAERNGADRPLVDPLTGKIVYSRWWRNHRFAPDDPATVAELRRAATSRRTASAPTAQRADDRQGRYNDWLRATSGRSPTIHPDGTQLAMWGGYQRSDERNSHIYGGAFTPKAS